jgi:hypothetical protein
MKNRPIKIYGNATFCFYICTTWSISIGWFTLMGRGDRTAHISSLNSLTSLSLLSIHIIIFEITKTWILFFLRRAQLDSKLKEKQTSNWTSLAVVASRTQLWTMTMLWCWCWILLGKNTIVSREKETHV